MLYLRELNQVITCFLLCIFFTGIVGDFGMFDIRYWRCVLKKSSFCPDNDIKFFLYTHESGSRRKRIDVKNWNSLKYTGWNSNKNNVIIIHGFNGTESKTPISLLRNAYIERGDYNVFTVDWQPLTVFPCYLSALSNTRLVGQCAAMLYSFLTRHGARSKKTHCVGHSLGAHICGMISSHLDKPQYKIIGLDPAQPLVDQYASREFRLTRDDALHVQIIHTNAGFLGETDVVGHVDFCVNGGRLQPGCKGHRLRRARCSHFQSACYFASAVRGIYNFTGIPCSSSCPKRGRGRNYRPGMPVSMGLDVPESAGGQYCVDFKHDKDCPFD